MYQVYFLQIQFGDASDWLMKYMLYEMTEVKVYCMGLATFEIDCSVKQMTFSL